MRATQGCLSLIEEFEGCILHIYPDIEGNPTIGIGHLIQKGETFNTPFTRKDAVDLFFKDIEPMSKAVSEMIRVPITQNQFNAVLSLCFNIGIEALRGSSVIRNINVGNFVAAARSILKWNKARVNGKLVVVNGLVNRREKEKQLFEKI